jgi:hypothetical protein
MSQDKELEPRDREDSEAAMSEREIDLNLIQTFPASDPPSWTVRIIKMKIQKSKVARKTKQMIRRQVIRSVES